MKLTVGQKVRVYEIMGRHPELREGEVVKVGRTLVTIKWFQWGGRYSHEQQFRMDTGRLNDGYGHSYFKTVEQDEVDKRRASAREYLRAVGIELTFWAGLTGPQIEELAAIVKNMLSEKSADRESEVKGSE